MVPPVDCDGVSCDPTQECCFTNPPPRFNCVTAGTCGGGTLACDERADCDVGEVCCHNPPDDIGATCVTTCEGITVCGTAEECPEGMDYCCEAMGGVFSICRDAPCG